MRAWRLAALAVLSLAAAPRASAGPALFPTTDVTIDYDAHSDRGDGRLRAEIAAGGQRLRVSSELLLGAVILDRPADAALLLQPGLHAALRLSLHAIGADLFFPDTANLTLTPAGTDHVAGRACTLWDASTERGHARLCLTSDGILLRAEGQDRRGRHGSLLARAVRYTPLSSDRFVVPTGWQTIPLGSLPGHS